MALVNSSLISDWWMLPSNTPRKICATVITKSCDVFNSFLFLLVIPRTVRTNFDVQGGVSIVIKMVPALSRHNLGHSSVVNSTISCARVLVRANFSLSALSCFLRPANLSELASASQASGPPPGQNFFAQNMVLKPPRNQIFTYIGS